jgi:RimJ/RimL family protein N-acetyltransferase
MAAVATAPGERSHANWRAGLPRLEGVRIALRELQLTDAASLHHISHAPDVSHYTWPAPSSVEEFSRFIEWTWAERTAGKYVCFGAVPRDGTAAAGLFEIRQMQPGFFRAELGFFLDPSLWGSGAFTEAARLVLEFAERTLHVYRIEARVAVDNARSNSALRRLGAIHEGVLRGAFLRNGQPVDQNLWTICPLTSIDCELRKDPR